MAAGSDDELVVVEQPLVALVDVHQAEPAAPVGVALKLVDRFLHRRGDVGALRLDDDERNAVHEQHDVGDEVLGRLARRALQLELVDRPEGVALGVVEVDEVDVARAALVPALDAVDLRALHDQAGGPLVGLQELRGAQALQCADRLGDAPLVEPGLPMLVAVDALQGLAEVVEEQDLLEGLSAPRAGVVEVAGGVLPEEATVGVLHGNKLVEEGLLDLQPLGSTAHRNSRAAT